jgi:hypothetical protein
MHKDNQIHCCIKEANPQNRPNFYIKDLAVLGAVGGLTGFSQVHLLGFYCTKIETEKKARTANSRFAKAGVWCFYESEVLNSSFVHLMKFVSS